MPTHYNLHDFQIKRDKPEYLPGNKLAPEGRSFGWNRSKTVFGVWYRVPYRLFHVSEI
jgi:hypothetical protein